MYAYVIPYLILVSYAVSLTVLAGGAQTIATKRLIFFFGLLPAILFVVLRGNVGTDTANYLGMVEEIRSNLDAAPDEFDVEIGFFLLMKALIYLFGTPQIVVNVISLFIALFAYRLFSSSHERILVFSLLIFPIFFFDMSMNGLRYALAFLLAKAAADRWNSGNKIISALVLVCGICVQNSGLLVFLLLIMGRFRLRNIIFLIPLGGLFYFAFAERLAYKFLAYQMLESPGGTSGLLPLLIFFGTYCAVAFGNSSLWKRFAFLAILELMAFALAKFSYAGLRFQLLILFAFFCGVSAVPFEAYGRRKNVVVAMLFVVGLVGFAGSVKHYIDDLGTSPSPFLPYKFYWESF